MKRLAANGLFTLAVLPFAIHQAFAGPGWGDSFDITGAPIKVQTYYANSPSGVRPNPLGGAPIDTGTPLRKFVDTLPGLGEAAANNLGQYIPVAMPEKWVDGNGNVTNDDYYELAVVEYTERMHSDLAKPTRLRGYVQISTPNNPGKHIALSYPDGSPILDNAGNQVYAVDHPHYLGPLISATRGVAVRFKYTNYLPVGAAGELFIPVDPTIPGAGLGPDGATSFTQNRVAIHWHGGDSPWISDGTPHQWIAPAGETAAYAAGMGKGVATANVPDMPDPGPGSNTMYFPNNLSARFMFYHDHTSGLTRLNVYAGVAAGYLVSDPVEQDLVNSGIIPAAQIPLVIQDKTFVPKDIAEQDAKWDTNHWGQEGDLWYPHVYETNQDPNSIDGTNPVGRWDWGPWFWPVFPAQYSLPSGSYGDVTVTPEAFSDTAVVNGTAYPTLTVDPQAYRLRVLNASNDRYLNLSLFVADDSIPEFDPVTGAPNPGYGKEVRMVPASVPTDPVLAAAWPATWPKDGRAGGVPDPATLGPDFVVIGSEGGLLPAPTVIPPHPITYDMNRRTITVLNVMDHGLYMGPAERADVVVDFSRYAGKTLIVYNDAPAPVPAFDPRIDYYTGDGDQSAAGGAGNTLPGYGPNTRTVMQIKVNAAPAAGAAFDLAALQGALPVAYGQSQERPIVPEVAYNAAFGTADVDNYAKISTGTANQPTFNWTATGPQTITGLTLTGGGTGYKTAPTVVFNGGGGTGAQAVATINAATRKVTGVTLTNPGTGYTSAPLITFTGGGGIGATATVQTDLTQSLPVQNKAIQELFDPVYGRMNATLGVELPFTTALTQTTIPLNYVDPATETVADGETQIWKITHNGVDSHPVHFHLVNVQVINRIGWDGTVKPPFPNELGWKETVTMNPLEDIVVALKAKRPQVPFGLPQSVRPMDPSQPLGSTLGFTQINPLTNAPKVVANAIANYDNEYVWHCHILGHEENDFMRPVVFKPTVVVPDAPGSLSVDAAGTLIWGDPTPLGGFDAANVATAGNAKNEIGFIVQRAPVVADVIGAFAEVAKVAANLTSWTDQNRVMGETYAYQVLAYNVAGTSLPSNIVNSSVPMTPPLAPSNLMANPVTASHVTLTWTDNASNEKSYEVLRDGALIGVLAAGATSYTDSTVTGNTTYSYEVRAVNPTGSASSGTISVATPYAMPLAPTLLTASSVTADQITLTWQDNAGNETSYEVWRNGVLLTTLATDSGTFVDSALTQNTTYTYEVRAVNPAGFASSGVISVHTSYAPPAAPGNLVAAPVAFNQVTLTWVDNAGNETSYEVWRNGALLTTLGVNAVTYVDNTVTENTAYSYLVKAVNPAGAVASNEVTLTTPFSVPLAPTGLTVLGGAAGAGVQATLSWTDVAFNESSYVVESQLSTAGAACNAAGAWTALSTLAAGSTGTTDATTAAGASYCYRVKAVNAAGSSAWAMSATAVTMPLVVTAPAALTATPNAAGTSVALAWNDMANNETAHQVWMSVNGGAYTLLTTLNSSTRQRTQTARGMTYAAVTTPGSIYSFQVVAIVVSGASTFASTPATVTADLTGPGALAAPTNLNAALATATSATLSWVDNANNENAYIVEASTNGAPFVTLATVASSNAQRTAVARTVTYTAAVVAGNTYSYQVKATATAFGVTATSAVAGPVDLNMAPPAAPSNVAAAAGAVGSRTATVTWTDNANNESGFTIQRSTLSRAGTWGAWANVGTTVANVTTFTNTRLTTGTSYRYQVMATGGAGNSAYAGPSNTVIAQ